MYSEMKTRVELEKVDESLSSDKGFINMGLRWLISDETMGAELGAVAFVTFPPGAEHKPHVHDHAEEYVIYVRGHGIRTVGGEQYEVGPGDVALVPRGVPHGMRNLSETEPIELFCIYAGGSSMEKTGYRKVE